MKAFRWQLRRGSRKEVCPECGRKTFVPYISTTDGTLAGAIYGRCDREQKCGYIKYPNGVKTPSKRLKTIKTEMQPITINNDIVLATLFQGHTLRNYLVELLGDDGREALNNYHVGGWQGATCWWQIDQQHICHAGKIMAYKLDGHRVKINDKAGITWAHKVAEWQGGVKGEELRQCLFGQHLLARRPNDIVCVVESEKTAVAMSVVVPNKVWLACGGLQGLSVDKCQALAGRQVVLVPDKGAFYRWKLTADNYGWHVSDFVEQEALNEGDDIWDVFEKQIKETRIQQ